MNIILEKDINVIKKYLEKNLEYLEEEYKKAKYINQNVELKKISEFLYSTLYKVIINDRLDIFEILIKISDNKKPWQWSDVVSSYTYNTLLNENEHIYFLSTCLNNQVSKNWILDSERKKNTSLMRACSQNYINLIKFYTTTKDLKDIINLSNLEKLLMISLQHGETIVNFLLDETDLYKNLDINKCYALIFRVIELVNKEQSKYSSYLEYLVNNRELKLISKEQIAQYMPIHLSEKTPLYTSKEFEEKCKRETKEYFDILNYYIERKNLNTRLNNELSNNLKKIKTKL